MENLLVIISIILFIGCTFIFLKYYSTNKNLIKVEAQKCNYEVICEQAHDSILVLDIVNGQIYKANASFGELLGYSSTQLKKLSIFDLFPKEDIHKSSEIFADVWEKKGLVYSNLPFVKVTGEHLPVECSAKVLSFDGKPVIVIYARDIRERLRLENEIRTKNILIEKKNKDITDSINYARRIQHAILPPIELIKKHLPDTFILYQPKDIVAGDFYWMEVIDNIVFIAAADCTGHGVPGAMVSVVCCNALNRAVKEFGLRETGKILDKVTDLVIETFEKSSSDVKDGMDISLLAYNKTFSQIQWSGANNPLWYFQNGQINKIKADKQPIGKYDFRKPFTTNIVDYSDNSVFYLFSDGFADQFGGSQKRKFMYSHFEESLTSICNLTMHEQEEQLGKTFRNWKGSLEQIDDVTVIGIKI